MHAPERLILPPVVRLEYAGPSALLHANDTLACGRHADDALSSFGDHEGLWYIHSHRHTLADMALHARALHLATGGGRGGSSSLLRNASLLIFNNNGASNQRFGHPSLVEWLHVFSGLGFRLRMLLATALNVGYSCGELHAIAATARIWRRFRWVLAVSGPDNLLTPHGALRGSIKTLYCPL